MTSNPSDPSRRRHWRWRSTYAVALLLAALAASLLVLVRPPVAGSAGATVATGPPRSAGYFVTRKVGSWSSLPSGAVCANRVRRSTWEPRPDNAGANHRMPSVTQVHRAFRVRPVAIDGAYKKRWDSWLLQRVTGHFTGRTDEIFQWAACKWGISDNVLRAIAVRESTWYQYDVYPSGRCVYTYSCGDLVVTPDAATRTFCDGLARRGHDYQVDHGVGRCPKTFGITGVMSWQAPAWGRMPGNQNGTFPFNRNSTAFAVDYIASQLRGCYEGWQWWLDQTGTRDYGPGRLWGCVGAWYAGEWRSADALDYIGLVRRELRNRTWLQPGWPRDRPACHPEHGCPRGVA